MNTCRSRVLIQGDKKHVNVVIQPVENYYYAYARVVNRYTTVYIRHTIIRISVSPTTIIIPTYYY